MDKKLVMRATVGWNNREDQVRLYSEDGIVELSRTSNIIIDNRGRPNRRKGITQLLEGDFHSLYGVKEDCYIVEDSALVSTLNYLAYNSGNVELTSIKELDLGYKVGYWYHGGKTYFTNTVEKGYISGTTAYSMPTQEIGRDTNREYIAAPIGSHIAVLDGRMLIADQNVLWFTEKFKFNLINKARGYIQFPTSIRLIAPVSTGFFVSDEDYTYYFNGFYPRGGQISENIIAPYPALAYSLCPKLVDSARLNIQLPSQQRYCRVWGSPEGCCVGGPGGYFENKNTQNIIFSEDYQNGSTLVWDGSFGLQGIVTQY